MTYLSRGVSGVVTSEAFDLAAAVEHEHIGSGAVTAAPERIQTSRIARIGFIRFQGRTEGAPKSRYVPANIACRQPYLDLL